MTNGAQQALSLLARAFLTPGAPVLVEAPTYHGALEAFRDAAAVLRALPVGLSGLEMAARQHRPALAYVISTFHNPTGSVLSPLAQRRLAGTAAATGVPLIDTSFAQAALRSRVAALPGSGLDASGRSEDYLRLHFLASPGDLTEATRRLAKAWRTYHPPPARVTSPAALTV
ncbi:MAG TPA: aminotransferase class I/II-fold pyridoxal phosphate-dependent enzyme [Streptosporangiaceae bacterium]|nr:aminotransferase class I/II-fold pyridoxal phosphate-dependent enzyme [Streptosporangiaceae bacterium]